MEELLQAKSVPLLLVLITVFLCIGLLKGVVEFVWKVNQKKEDVRDDSIRELILSVKKTNHSINNVFTALKILSGESWDEIKKILAEKNDLDI